MASTSRRIVASVLFVVLLLVASDMGTTRVAEARYCVSQSHRFKGLCVRSENCASVCNTENFVGGVCVHHGWGARKCFCKKVC